MGTSVSLPLLDRVRVASPCTVRWEDMAGDDRVRRCEQCNLNVHNFSAMTRDEAEGVLAGLAHGRVCGWFYRRADGTVLTQDCPVGFARVRAGARGALARVAALIGLIGVAGVAAGMTGMTTWGDRVRLRATKPYSVLCEWIAPSAPPAVTKAAMPGPPGEIAIMPSPRPASNGPIQGSRSQPTKRK